MHPLFQDRDRLLLYFGGWLAAAIFVIALLAAGGVTWAAATALVAPIAVVESFFSLSTWYVVRTVPLRETQWYRLLVVNGAAALLSSGGLLFLVQVWARVLNAAAGMALTFEPRDLRLIFGAGVLLYFLTASIHYLLAAFLESRGAEHRSFEAQILARESEVKALRAQIDPHFLFNSLNSISALTAADPSRARTMTIQLAEFFRASVAAGRQQAIPLSDEVELLRHYLAIEQVRFGDRLAVSFSIDDAVRAFALPPLLLQPLVENAVKHGIAGLVEGGTIAVDARRDGPALIISVRNPFDPAAPAARHGGTAFGLDAVRDRVRAFAPADGRVDVDRADGTFTVRVTLPVS